MSAAPTTPTEVPRHSINSVYEDHSDAKLDSIRRKYTHEHVEKEISITPYRLCWWRCVLSVGACVLTLGLLLLFIYWQRKLVVWLFYEKCPPKEATCVWVDPLAPDFGTVSRRCAIRKGSHQGDTSAFPNYFAETDGRGDIRFFVYCHFRFILSTTTEHFERLEALDTDVTTDPATGLSTEQASLHRTVYGKNALDIEKRSVVSLLFEEVLHPFFLFQMFSIIVWCLDEYYYYSVVIFVITVISTAMGLYETLASMRMLGKMAKHNERSVAVVRDGERCAVSVDSIVPGDVIVLDGAKSVPCDATVLSGSIIVNEAMLTGESVPVTKSSPARDKPVSPATTIYAGTSIIQCRPTEPGEPVLAMVTATGFDSAKGQLIRMMLYPRPVNIRFRRDSYRFVAVLALVALVGCIFYWIRFAEEDVSGYEIFIRLSNLITIVIPPALPACVTIGTAIALRRLKSVKIFCTSPLRINLAGKINVVCFDKTGTLTEDGLDVKACCPVSVTSHAFEPLVHDISTAPKHMLLLLASCHSVTNLDGELIGDPLDVATARATGFKLTEEQVTGLYPSSPEKSDVVRVVERTGAMLEVDTDAADETGVSRAAARSIALSTIAPPSTRLVIARTFDFSSEMQRSGVVVVEPASNDVIFFCKGAPEKIKSLCRPESIPQNFDDVLDSYTRQGFRVLACAGKDIPNGMKHAEFAEQTELEKDVEMAGLLIMENRIKPQSAPSIAKLNDARIRSLMVTGDNLMTAVSVARDVGLTSRSKPLLVGDVDEDSGEVIFTLDENEDISYTAATITEARTLPEELAAGHLTPSALSGGDEDIPVELALTGKAFEHLHGEYASTPAKADNIAATPFAQILVAASVFARMSPVHKTQLVEDLILLGYQTAMCGDGANDCGALKASHVGLALSCQEASIAAPFTSRNLNISAMPELIRQGRSALTTMFQIFKYIALYAMVQFISVVLLYWIRDNLMDFQYLYIDLFLVLPIGVFMAYTPPSALLTRRRPSASLVSLSVISSVVGHIVLVFLFQLLAILLVQEQGWYVKYDPEEASTYENAVIFSVGNFQYLFLSITVSHGHRFRKSVVANLPMTLTLVLNFIFCAWVMVKPTEWMQKRLEVQRLPEEFLWKLIFYIAGNTVAAHLYERWFVAGPVADFLAEERVLKNVTKFEQSSRHWLAVTQRLTSENPVSANMSNKSQPLASQEGVEMKAVNFADSSTLNIM